MFSYKKKYNSTSLTADDVYREAIESGGFILLHSNKLTIKNQHLKSHDANKGKIISNLFKGVYVSIYIHTGQKNIIVEFFLLKQLVLSIIVATITEFIFMIFGHKLFMVSIIFFIFTFFLGVIRAVKSIEKIIQKKI